MWIIFCSLTSFLLSLIKKFIFWKGPKKNKLRGTILTYKCSRTFVAERRHFSPQTLYLPWFMWSHTFSSFLALFNGRQLLELTFCFLFTKHILKKGSGLKRKTLLSSEQILSFACVSFNLKKKENGFPQIMTSSLLWAAFMVKNLLPFVGFWSSDLLLQLTLFQSCWKVSQFIALLCLTWDEWHSNPSLGNTEAPGCPSFLPGPHWRTRVWDGWQIPICLAVMLD